MIDLFRLFRRAESHYEQQAKWEINTYFRNQSKKIADVCQEIIKEEALEEWNKPIFPADPRRHIDIQQISEDLIMKSKLDKELRRIDFDLGIFLPHSKASTFRIKE